MDKLVERARWFVPLLGMWLAGCGQQAAVADKAADPAARAAGTAGAGGAVAGARAWDGVWDVDWSTIFGPGAMTEKPVLTPAYAAKFEAYQAAQKRGEEEQSVQANCVPPGLPVSMSQPYPVEFLFTPGKITVAIEAYSQMRRIFMDGRKPPEDPDPTYQGYSIGHWEGDELVVDTTGVLPETMLAPGVGHSDKLHLQEHIRKTAPDVIEIKTTMTDPDALAQPWTITRRYIRKPGWDIKEYVCVQNNHDSADAQGRAGQELRAK